MKNQRHWKHRFVWGPVGQLVWLWVYIQWIYKVLSITPPLPRGVCNHRRGFLPLIPLILHDVIWFYFHILFLSNVTPSDPLAFGYIFLLLWQFFLRHISQKVNIFEIGSLEVYDRGGGGAQVLHCIASLHVLYSFILSKGGSLSE